MKLREMTDGGRPLAEKLDALLQALGDREPSSPDLYVHLLDIHDGAVRLEQSIAELARCKPEEIERINSLLWAIRAELFEHLVPNHVEQLRPGLQKLCSRLAENVHAATE